MESSSESRMEIDFSDEIFPCQETDIAISKDQIPETASSTDKFLQIREASTANSLRTVDDVLECLSIHEEQHGDIARHDAIQFVDRICSREAELAESTRNSIDSLVSYLAPICPMPKSLFRLLYDCDTILGGLQAISLFYPLVNFTQSTWDFYCDSRLESSQNFVDGVKK